VLTLIFAAAFAAVLLHSAGAFQAQDDRYYIISGTLSKLDLSKARGLLTTDFGRPVYFDVPNPYLFENVTIGARITLRLDEAGRAVKVMDSAIPDIIDRQDRTDQLQEPTDR